MEIIDVNRNGQSPDGETYDQVAAPYPVEMGYMVNVAVKLRYPNGKLRNGNKVMITPKGMEFFQREMPLSIRNTTGGAQ
ncbi:hypothetical protein EXN61_21705 [Agrobacterium tumefaciens]|uniref:Uncharacterized protein n=1 Tax=Agrobacterium tumefaciens TaxID=358 RepID=A0A546XRU6_AGRTU|nr:hypothetical protein [Agrobacterium tumefaciens]TRB03481.1 hypothetical protein EXN61_21705 [Agrobacterium tumefaciens]